MAGNDEAVIQVKEQLEQQLQASGQLGQMRAMIVSASLAALKEQETPDQQLFHSSPALKDAKANKVENFRVIADYLSSLGLQHTLSVLSLESGIDKAALKQPPRAKLDALVEGGTTAPKAAPATSTTQAAAPSPSPDSTAATATTAPAVAAPATASNGSSQHSSPASSPAKSSAPASPTKDDDPHAANPVIKKGDENLYELEHWEGGVFTRWNQINSQPFQCYDLKKTKMYVYDSVAAVTMDDCYDCELVVAACSSSIFLRNCHRMKVIGACKQLRTRDCSDLDINLFGLSDPVVEESSNVVFRPFNLKSPKLGERMKQAGLDPAQNRFCWVYDFTPESKTAAQPHFKVLLGPEDHKLTMESFGGHLGECEAPVEVVELLEGKREPAPSSEGGKGFDIKKGSSAWTSDNLPQSTGGINDAAPAKGISAPSKTVHQTISSAAPAPKPAAKAPSSSSSSSRGYESFEDSSDDGFDAKKAAKDVDTEDDDSF